jgi:DHA2 family multidrug resistance protein-like MFS transporter
VGLALLAAGLALLAVSASSPQPVGIWWQLALCGLGFGIFQSPNNHTIITSAPVKRSGAASGMLGTARLTGQSLGAVLLGGVFSLAGSDHSQAPRIALTLAAFFAAAASIFSALRVKHAVR